MMLAPVILLFLGPKNAVIFIILLESAMAVVFTLKERLNFEITHIFLVVFQEYSRGYFCLVYYRKE
jgi:uncharacterized Tic20 family protein